MSPSPGQASTKVTLIDLEFETIPSRGAPLGDVASSLVSLHDLLRDLGTLAAYPSRAEYRDIRVVAIDVGSPLKITLSLLAIPPQAVRAFQEICRDIIFFRERRSHHAALTPSQQDGDDAKRLFKIKRALDLVLRADGNNEQITEKEAQRLYGHIVTLQNAEVPLKRVVVKEG